MMKNTMIIFAAVIASVALTLVQPAHAANNDVRVRTALAGKGLASGRSAYRERLRGNVLGQRFKVSIEDATPGDSLNVSVNGIMFGTIIVNDLGGGFLQFRTETLIDNPGDGSSIPTDFPRLQVGDVITVGGMVGTYN